MSAFIIFVSIVVVAVMSTLTFNSMIEEKPQNLINQFEKPVCVEQTVGKDIIKKCYELKEVK